MTISIPKEILNNKEETYKLIDLLSKNNISNRINLGEVFTPVSIIDELLDELDIYYVNNYDCSIFSIPNLKWLDSTSGIGNFLIAVFFRLFKNLADKIPNEQARIKHIIKNMLYFSEINNNSSLIIEKIFDINNIKPNIFKGDSLKIDFKEYWNIPNGFDIIIGNPPYNKQGIKSHNNNLYNSDYKTVWTDFLDHSLKHLNNNGFLVYITPLSWLRSTHKYHDILLKQKLIYLQLWDNLNSYNFLNAKIPISLYILQNQSNNSYKTKIISKNRFHNKYIEYEILNPGVSLPTCYFSIFKKLLKFVENNKYYLEFENKTVGSTGERFLLPDKYKLSDNLAIDSCVLKDGIYVKRTNNIHPHQHLSKLIFANKSSFKQGFIDKGKLSLTGNHKFYILGPNLAKLKKLFDFKIANVISNFTKYGQDFLDKHAFMYIPDIRLIKEPVDEPSLYKLIGFNKNELALINKF